MKEGPVKVGLMGLGTVGTGVYKVMQRNAEDIALRAGLPVTIAKIAVRDLNKERSVSVPRDMLTDDPRELVEDPEIDIVVEVMGGMENTLDLLLTALRNGKSVVTANKDLIAEHGRVLLDTAAEYRCDFLFEASVAGGVPIVRPLKQCLAGNRISQVMGIINGTTNYILTKMTEEGLDFETALRQAQELGYAEADPTSDVEGYDAARKIAILASLAFNSRVVFSQVEVAGITSVTDRDVRYARELGYVIKLLAIAKHDEERGALEVAVRPTLVPVDHPLAAVGGAYNAIFVRGDAVGEAMFHGLGAGELPTASAVVGDVVEAVRNLRDGVRGRILCTCYRNIPIKPVEETYSRFYLRALVADRPGVLGAMATVLGEHGVSIASMLQKSSRGDLAEIVVVTHTVRQGSLMDAVARLRDHEVVDTMFPPLHVEH
ncbi:MAG: homoserine dehydrogenase [Alicyclobacillaceae bacterium]|nr:homoserine dehydrogenase [Alicyclobacillaceae bacterium]